MKKTLNGTTESDGLSGDVPIFASGDARYLFLVLLELSADVPIFASGDADDDDVICVCQRECVSRYVGSWACP